MKTARIKTTDERTDKNLLKIVVIVTVGWALFLVSMSYFNRPISDDYAFSEINPSISPLVDGLTGYTSGNGRFGQYFTFSSYQLLFGLRHAVMAAPIINTVFLVTSVFLFLYALKRKFRFTISNEWLGWLGAFTSLIMLMSARSIFDSSLWTDSSVSYIPSMAFMFLDLGAFLWLLNQKHPKWWQFSVFIATILCGQQFSEPTSAIMIVFFAVICFFILVSTRAIRATIPAALGTISSIAGLLVIYFSPGSTARRMNYHSTFDFSKVFIDSLRYFSNVSDLIFSWRAPLYVALGVIIFYLARNQIARKRQKTIIVSIGLMLMVLPYYILFVITEYSSPGYLALRTYQVPAALCGIGLSMIISVVIDQLSRLVKHPSHKLIIISRFTMAIIIASSFVVSFRPLSNIVEAQVLRSIQYDFREYSIAKQVNAGKSTIDVLPAPSLLSDSEPGEFTFDGSEQIPWFLESFKHFYHLEGKNLNILPAQESPYCMFRQGSPWWQIESCEQVSL